jgi:hypothetical protein
LSACVVFVLINNLVKGYKTTMSGFRRNTYTSDRTTQAIALLGGATAHSYSSLSLHNSLVNPESAPNIEDEYAKQGGAEAFQQGGESAGSILDKAIFDSGSATPYAGVPQYLILDELVAFDAIQDLPTNKNMTSLFDDGTLDSADSQSVSDLESGAESDLVSLAELTEPGNQAFSLQDFIEQVVGEAETSQEQFTNALDPATEPLLGTTFYADSVATINGLLDSFLQPIGSFSMSRFEPMLSMSADELATYLG